MLWRILGHLLFQCLAGVAGWMLAGQVGALIGVVMAGLGVFVLDSVRGARMLDWLRKGECRVPPFQGGMWGEMADRIRRIVRELNQQNQHSVDRLQEFLEAIQASPNGVVLLDPVGQIEWCNQTAADHLGFDPKRDLGQWVGNLVRNPVFTAYYASQHFNHDVTIERRNSTLSHPMLLSLQVHPYGEGRKLLLSRDITAVEQAEAMRRDFVANVSHEIRTPLTVLSGFVETLQNLPLNEAERARYLNLMALQSQRMQGLVSDLLTLSRLEGSPSPSLQEWHGLADMMAHCEEEALALSASVTASTGKPHHLVFAPTPAFEVAGASGELFSAFSNLISNAVRYTPPDGHIAISWHWLEAEGQDKRLVFSVKDSGPGIAQEHLPRLTERFYRVDRSRSRETGGTGLGLAIVKHVLQRHGAELKISSEVGQGSCFAIVLPAKRLRPVGVTTPLLH